jgi:hypothetical protein
MASQATLTGAFAEELVFAMNDLSSTVGLMRREFRDVHAVVSRLGRESDRESLPTSRKSSRP